MMTIDQLPRHWRDEIRELRNENAKSRMQRRELVDRLAKSEAQNAKYREQRRELRAEVTRLQAELAARGECDECHCQERADAADIAKGVCPRSGAEIGTRGNCTPDHWDACRQCPLNCNR